MRFLAVTLTVCVLCSSVSDSVLGAEPARVRPSVNPLPALDVLEAEAKGLVSVKYIPNDARSAQVLVENKSGMPLSLRLPSAFVGVPVLAQMGMGGMGGVGLGGMGAGGGGVAAQATGGGGVAGGVGAAGAPGGAAGGGMFAVPPERVRSIRVATVCLEYGKPEPGPRLPYRMVAVDTFSADPRLALILEAFGRGEIPQKVAQAVAWHLASGVSWQQLAAEKINRAGGYPDEPYFSSAELTVAYRVVNSPALQLDGQPTATSAGRVADY